MIRLLPPVPLEPSTSTPTWRTCLRDRATEWLFRALDRLGAPGAIRDLDFHDEVNGCTVAIRVGLYFTIITLDGRDYYFNRLSGRLDGTGQAV